MPPVSALLRGAVTDCDDDAVHLRAEMEGGRLSDGRDKRTEGMGEEG